MASSTGNFGLLCIAATSLIGLALWTRASRTSRRRDCGDAEWWVHLDQEDGADDEWDDWTSMSNMKNGVSNNGTIVSNSNRMKKKASRRRSRSTRDKINNNNNNNNNSSSKNSSKNGANRNADNSNNNSSKNGNNRNADNKNGNNKNGNNKNINNNNNNDNDNDAKEKSKPKQRRSRIRKIQHATKDSSNRKIRSKPPRPNHFVSVRIDNAHIWQQVSTLQGEILRKFGYLREAAIPVQDLHLTLFVATLLEEDGTLQRAKNIIKNCGDILREHGLSPVKDHPAGTRPSAAPIAGKVRRRNDVSSDKDAFGSASPPILRPQALSPQESGPAARDEVTAVDGKKDHGDDVEVQGNDGMLDGERNSDRKRSTHSAAAAAATAALSPSLLPITLSFHGLGHFDGKVLFARVVEDRHMDRLRSLASALHCRFVDAGLVEPTPTRDGATARKGSAEQVSSLSRGVRDGEPEGTGLSETRRRYRFEFNPHLTIMKTSKLEDKRTIIPPNCYERHREALEFGSHELTAVELSSMLERDDEGKLLMACPEGGQWEELPYYKCQQSIALPHSPRSS